MGHLLASSPAMNSMEGRSFSELQLGIRELFRVVVPGAYVIVLFKFLTRETEFYVTASGSTLSLVIAEFFSGLLAMHFAYTLPGTKSRSLSKATVVGSAENAGKTQPLSPVVLVS